MSPPRDPDTQQDTVDLDGSTLGGTTVPRPPAEAGAPTVAETVADALLDGVEPGRRYDVGDVLGSGGMGVVRLYHDRLIGRDVALKLIHGERSDEPGAVQRFLREARIQAQLEHPSIVPIHDVGRTADGRAFFTMKRVRGRTLAEIIDDLAAGDLAVHARFSRRKLLTAFVSVCQAIELAHASGVLHRDLKPQNIMLGDFGEVYVLDWGIARPGANATGEPVTGDAAAASSGSIATVAGAVIGTPGYLSPEQAAGDLAALDGRTDVYALGAILFELLALQPLHPRSTAAALASTVSGPDARPSSRAPDRDIPPELDAVCVAATSIDPADRLASVHALAAAVERFLDGDRDLELRRRLAAEHAQAADAMAAVALVTDDEGGRSKALQEVGRALALDPENPDARRVMVGLLTTPPRSLPAAADAALDASALATQRFAARMGVIAYVTWATAIPIGLWMGIVHRGLFGFFIVAHVAALSACAWAMRARRAGGAPLTAAIIAVWLATCSLGLVFGPLVLLPTVIAATLTTILLQPRPGARTPVIVGFCGLILIPIALELIGAIPASYRFDAGAMTLVPRMVRFTEAPTLLALIFGSMATVVTLAIAITRLRTMLSAAELRLQLHAWQLRQLVP